MTDKQERFEYAVFDGRYVFDPDGATICEFCNSLLDAQEVRPNYGHDSVIIRYRVIGGKLSDPTRMPDTIGEKP